jgi:cytochrome c-type biogenesis protein CcmH/NrfF
MEPESDTRNQIKVVTKKAYSIFQKLFCCRCFHCMRADDESMLTSDIRKQVLQRMIKNFDIESNVKIYLNKA